MVGAGRGAGDPTARKPSLLEPAVRPLELCDLCEVAVVDYAPGSANVPFRAHIQVPVPPFGEDRSGNAPRLGPDTVPGRIDILRRRLRCVCNHHAEGREKEDLVARITGEFYADARLHASGLLVEALFALAARYRDLPRYACADAVWGRGDLATAAHAALSKRPELQFPLDFACVLPSHRLAGLLSSPEGHFVMRRPDGKACVNVAGLDIIPYGPGHLGPHAAHNCQQPAAAGTNPQDPFPAFVVPGRGSLGLAISDITVRENWDGGRLAFDGSYLVGADVLRPEGIVGVFPAASRGA